MNQNHFLRVNACSHFELGQIDLSRVSFHVSLVMSCVFRVVQIGLSFYVRFLQDLLHDANRKNQMGKVNRARSLPS